MDQSHFKQAQLLSGIDLELLSECEFVDQLVIMAAADIRVNAFNLGQSGPEEVVALCGEGYRECMLKVHIQFLIL